MYLPSAYVTETMGPKVSISLGMLMTTLGMWLNYLDLFTVAVVFVGLGMPFIVNTATKISATWFGPKGRNVATTLLLLGYFVPNTIEEFIEESLIKWSLYISIICSVLTPLCYVFIFEKPDMSPTMSQEEKLNSSTRPFK